MSRNWGSTPMAKAPERTYLTAAARHRAERLRERRRAADREDAPMFLRNVVEMDLAAQGVIDLQAGERLDIALDEQHYVATVRR